MKKIRSILSFVRSNLMWLISISFICLFFIFLAWIAYPKEFWMLVRLMLLVSIFAITVPLYVQIRQKAKIDKAFHQFLIEPDEQNECLLCMITPAVIHPYIQQLGGHLRQQQLDRDTFCVQLSDYESYIESWVHEVKKPLSLVTLLLDNRKNEISPLVQQRMIHARNQIRQDVEQILYFSRLGAVHKDYIFTPVSILTLCQEAVEDNVSLLDGTGFVVQFSGEDCKVISDRKGLLFILGQLISNSVQYATQQDVPLLSFTVSENTAQQIVLSIQDNGSGISSSDLPFVFDKGFTGGKESYFSRSTGMGLFLVQKMSADLAIELQIASALNIGTTISLLFPKIEERTVNYDISK